MKYIETTEQDLPQLNEWIKEDHVHKDIIIGSFWINPLNAENKPVKGVKCLKVQDDNGTVFYMRLEQALRVYIQFPPEQEVSKSRMASALRRMIHFIGRGAKTEGYQEAVFNSKSEHLISFLKRLGIEKLEDSFRIKL